MNKIREEIKKIRQLDYKTVTIFISIAIIQTFSWYYTSRRFFRINLYQYFQDNPNINIIEYVYWFLGDSFTFFILPSIIIIFFFKESITNYGLKLGEFSFGIKLSIIIVLVILMIAWFVSPLRSFYYTYPYLQEARDSWQIFLAYEFLLAIYIFSWEFFWRGFMLFGFEPKFGYYSIFIQMVPFVILHNGKPALETFSAIVGGILLGMLALKTRSFIYGVVVHFCLIFSVDLLSTLRYKTNDFGVGFNSLISIFFQ